MKWVIGRIGAVAVASMLPVLAFAQSQQDFNNYGWGPAMMGWNGMFLGPFFMIFSLVFAIAAVVLLLRWMGGSGYSIDHLFHPGAGRKALDILKERYARGEIDKQEFEERRRTLGE